ncbi:MAG: DUF5317 family protein [Ilumatobacteraceae bacterium]
MIIVVASLLAVATVPMCGGSLLQLAQLPLRHVWLVWLSIGLQLVITVTPGFPVSMGQPLHVFTFAASALFMVANRHIAGTLVIALGAAMNFAAIAANGGTMPASEWAWRTAGFPMGAEGFENSAIVKGSRLQWLGDVFAVPHGWPLANVFSVGDVVIVIGVGYLAHKAGRAGVADEQLREPATAMTTAA